MPKKPPTLNAQFVSDLLRVTGKPFPLELYDGMPLGHIYAVGAFARCRALLEGMDALIKRGTAEGSGLLLRAMFESFMVARWCIADPNEAITAMVRSDFAFEEGHRRRLGLKGQAWNVEAALGPRPDKSDRLNSEDIKKRTGAALKGEGEGEDSQFIYDGFNSVFGPESYLSAHPSIRSVEGYLVTDGDDLIEVSALNSATAHDADWRLPMAASLVAKLASLVFEIMALDASELDALTGA